MTMHPPMRQFPCQYLRRRPSCRGSRRLPSRSPRPPTPRASRSSTEARTSPWQSASVPAAATTSTRACWRATWASTFRAIRDRAAKHAGRRQPARRAASVLGGAEGRHRVRHLQPHGHRAAARPEPQLRRHQVHLARQHHQRGQRLRHLAHLTGEDLEGLPGEAGHAWRRPARAPSPTSSRSSTRTCSTPRSSWSPAIPAPPIILAMERGEVDGLCGYRGARIRRSTSAG